MAELNQDFELESESVSNNTEKNKTVLVPKMENMDNYLLKHFKPYILAEINQRLAEGRITEVISVPVRSERILPEDCVFQRFSYWRLNQTDFRIQIDTRIELMVETKAGVDTDFFDFYVELWYSFCNDDDSLQFERIGLLSEKPEYDECWKLDKYLVPVLRRDEIDANAEAMWELHYPTAAKDGKLRNPRDLASKLGLSIVKHKLYKRKETKAIIFFREGKILTQPERLPGSFIEPEPVEVAIPAKTIVLNRHSDALYDYDLDIYHECIHYEWHFLFYQLQNMYSNDLSQLKKVRRPKFIAEDQSSPIQFMEQQARYGSYGLMMPATFMRDAIGKMYKEIFEGKRKDGNFDHDGRRYEVIARNIASENTLSKAKVRARMIQLGYTAAKGALNYVDGRYITPFAFSEMENALGSDTYVIDRKTVAHLYNTDKQFQKIMQSGKFAFVDGHIVYCESAGIRYTPDGARLSPWANAHIDRVSLRFSRVYTGDHSCKYTFGQMNSEEDLHNAFKFLDMNGSMTLKELETAKNKFMEDMPMSFHSALAFIMKGRTTVDELANRIPISRRTLLRLRTEERKNYDLDQVIAICIGLHLPPWLSEILLEKAGLSVKRYGPYGYYGTILDCFFPDTIPEVQQYLAENGFEQLKLNFDSEAD